jgi:4-amino-4-deoxy-L-arabinose transferase-like glycosyltransferase
MTPSLIDRWSRGWRGPWLAALITLIAILPGLIALPATDRGETRLAEASAQMLESGDFVATAVNDQASDRRPAGLHWLQAAVVAIVSDAEARQIWAYRLPGLLGAMIAAAACAWGGAGLFGPGAGLLAGSLLGSSFLLSTAGVVDAPSALLCGGVTLAVSALARLYLAATGALVCGRATRVLLWLGLGLAALAGGPIGPAVVILTGAALWSVDRAAPWPRSLGWGWGVILTATLVGPSWVAGAINPMDGAAPRWPGLGAVERAPGFHLLVAPLMLFPLVLPLPSAAALAWRGRREPAVKVALCWLLPSWLMLEFGRGHPLAGGLIVYGPIAWLAGAAFARGGRAPRLGVGMQLLTGLIWVAAVLYAGAHFGGRAAVMWSLAAAGLLAAASVCASLAGSRAPIGLRRPWRMIGLALALGVLAHGVVLAGVGPRLHALWVAQRAAAALGKAGLDPRGGVTPGPVALIGYGEPSLTFALGGLTEALLAEDAAAAIGQGRPAVVEARQQAAFLAALTVAGRRARQIGEVDGFDYANNKPVRLILYAAGP